MACEYCRLSKNINLFSKGKDLRCHQIQPSQTHYMNTTTVHTNVVRVTHRLCMAGKNEISKI